MKEVPIKRHNFRHQPEPEPGYFLYLYIPFTNTKHIFLDLIFERDIMILLESHVSGCRRSWCVREENVTGAKLLHTLTSKEGCVEDVVLQCEGRVLSANTPVPDNTTVIATLRLCGGKGGFGSMLRAIGAQIEKTTNREACRDLSGRRLRDINEEKRLKDFISKKAEREREVLERKKQKFLALKNTPKHVFEDETYFQQRELREKNLYDSLDKAYANSSDNGSGPSGIKRDSSALKDQTAVQIKRKKFLDDLDESSDEDSDDDGAVAVAREDSNNSSDNDTDNTTTPLTHNKDIVSSDESSETNVNDQVVPENKQDTPQDKQNTHEDKQDTPEDTQNTPQDKQNAHEDKQDTPQDKQNAHEDKQDTPQDKQNAHEDKQDTPQDKQNVADEKQAAAEDKEDAPEDKQVVAEDKQVVTEDKQVAPEDKQSCNT
ncbi:hypothetical protein Pcinc_025695 [Petrolisthes cinctipes]|uniref:SDE2-like domain-containing protein n=1 Tax=Petrolisthes cinctipes TaxID=88211 RepID=A0AAE1F892_PETCI|nr:hypothetical protein Pcinc_025695 [Petrolisthes cinctipes]